MAKKPAPLPPVPSIERAIAEATKPAPENAQPAMPDDLYRDFQIVAGAAGMAALPDQQHQAWKESLNRIAAAVLAGLKKG